MTFLEELKRRNVIRVGIAYIVVAWITAQVAELALDSFEAPGWVIKTILLLLALGFPLALFFAWAFELTPEGLKKEKDVDRSQSIPPRTGRKLDQVIIVVLLALTGVLLFQQLSPSLNTLSRPAADEAAPIPIAVLPFADLSAAGDQEYLGDGVAEEILNVLANVDGLKVTSRTSSFAFKGENRPMPEIANILGVSHVVEGSIRKQDDRVRITAQLIDVSNDSHVWSETYDSKLSDIFRLQDEIARQISAALSTSLNLTLPTLEREAPNWNVGAYELYLQARKLVLGRDSYDEAIELLDAALKLEPEFADAWAEKATALHLGAFGLGFDPETFDEAFEAEDQAWIAARRAIEIDPQHPLGLAVMGGIRSQQKRWIEARVFFDRAVSVRNPSDNAWLWLGILKFLTGDSTGAFEAFDAGLEASPAAPNLIRWRTYALLNQNRLQEAWQTRDLAPELAMQGTTDWQHVAGLRLGEISTDDFLEYLGTTRDRTPEQAASITDLIRKYSNRETGELDSQDFEALRGLWEFQFMIAAIFPEFANQLMERTWREILVAPNRNNLGTLWSAAASSFRGTAEFSELVHGLNLPAYWDVYGWPEMCRPVGASDFVCDQP